MIPVKEITSSVVEKNNSGNASFAAEGSNNIEVLERILATYKEMDGKRAVYKKSIKKMRVGAINLREEKEKLQLELSIATEPDGENAPFTDTDTLAKKIDSNNSLAKEKTCSLAIEHIRNIESTISADSKKAQNFLGPLETSVQLLKKQVQYTRHLEETLELFSQQKALKQKLDESDKIITVLSELLV